MKFRCKMENHCANYIVASCSKPACCLKPTRVKKHKLSFSKTSENGIGKKCRSILKVRCLQNLDGLRRICDRLGLKFNASPYYGKFYLDMICNDRFVDGVKHFLVKWKDHRTTYDTWEPKHDLLRYKCMIDYYEAVNNGNEVMARNLVEHFVNDVTTRKPYDILVLTKLCALFSKCSEEYVNTLKLSITQLKGKAKEVLTFNSQKLKKKSNELFDLMKFFEKRKQVLINLKEWEIHINSLNQSTHIKVENNVDLEKAPSDFKFITDYINNAVDIPAEPLTFCCCDNCYENRKKSCCPLDSDGHFAYSRHKRLELQPGYPIYECNKRCKCDSTCVNRVVQHGQNIKVVIFRTPNDRGWGLKTLENIEKGQFVMEYIGEIITFEEAEARGNIYDYVGRSYLFDLDYGVDKCMYTVDAGHFGNASHFINHSCDPNLHVFAVWINQPDPNLPRLAFFARRKIKRGEELTFDYKMEKKLGDWVNFENSSLTEYMRIPCKCNSKNCRKYLF